MEALNLSCTSGDGTTLAISEPNREDEIALSVEGLGEVVFLDADDRRKLIDWLENITPTRPKPPTHMLEMLDPEGHRVGVISLMENKDVLFDLEGLNVKRFRVAERGA